MSLRLVLPCALAVLLAPLAASAQPSLSVETLGTYATGVFDDGAAEIAAYHAPSQRIFFVNAAAAEVVALDLSDPSAPSRLFSIDASALGDGANSVTVAGDVVAVAIEAASSTDPGLVAFYDVDGTFLNAVTTGALPDGLAASPDGSLVVVANEGEPSDDYMTDPEGSISVVDLSSGAAAATVTTLDFTDFNEGNARHGEIADDPSIRIYGPGASVAQDLEPEFPVISPDGQTAYVSLQENNAIAVVDLTGPSITAVLGLGFKNYALEHNALDASNRDDDVRITTWPVYGMYQPDGMAAAEIDGETYVFTANEGDARDYDAFSEEDRVEDLALDPVAIPDAAFLQDETRLGRLKVTNQLGDVDGDGDFETLFAYGARSFSVHAAGGARIYDSGDVIEREIAARIAAGDLPMEAFNANNDDNDSFDSRSDDKGVEPEGVVVGEVDGTPYAFVGLERIGGVMAFDVTVPTAPTVAAYITTRNFDADIESAAAGDLAPEGLVFVAAENSPVNRALLVTSNEVSGSVTVHGLGNPSTDMRPDPEGARALTGAAAAPNPTREAAVHFDLAVPADVTLTVFDALGREVSRRTAEGMPAGEGQSLRVDESAGLPAGVYLYRLEARSGRGVAHASGRFTLIR